MGFIKIRKRDMSVILEASGWAVNVNMRLNAALGRLFTHVPHLPKGARKERRDIVVQFVKDFSNTSIGLMRRRLYIVVLIILFLFLIFILGLVIYPGLKSLIG